MLDSYFPHANKTVTGGTLQALNIDDGAGEGEGEGEAAFVVVARYAEPTQVLTWKLLLPAAVSAFGHNITLTVQLPAELRYIATRAAPVGINNVASAPINAINLLAGTELGPAGTGATVLKVHFDSVSSSTEVEIAMETQVAGQVLEDVLLTPTFVLDYNSMEKGLIGRSYIQLLAFPDVRTTMLDVTVEELKSSEPQSKDTTYVVGEVVTFQHTVWVKGNDQLTISLQPPTFLAYVAESYSIAAGSGVEIASGVVDAHVKGAGAPITVRFDTAVNFDFGGGPSRDGNVSLTTQWVVADVNASSNGAVGSLNTTVTYGTHRRELSVAMAVTEPVIQVDLGARPPSWNEIYGLTPGVDSWALDGDGNSTSTTSTDPTEYSSLVYQFRIDHDLLNTQLVPGMEMAVSYQVTGANASDPSSSDLKSALQGMHQKVIANGIRTSSAFGSNGTGVGQHYVAGAFGPLDVLEGEIKVQYHDDATIPWEACIAVTVTWLSKAPEQQLQPQQRRSNVGSSSVDAVVFFQPRTTTETHRFCYMMPRPTTTLSASAIGGIVGGVLLLIILSALLFVVLVTMPKREKEESLDEKNLDNDIYGLALDDQLESYEEPVAGGEGYYGTVAGAAAMAEYADVADAVARQAVESDASEGEYDDVADTGLYSNRAHKKRSPKPDNENTYGLSKDPNTSVDVYGLAQQAQTAADLNGGKNKEENVYGLRRTSADEIYSNNGGGGTGGNSISNGEDADDTYDNHRLMVKGVGIRKLQQQQRFSQIYGLGDGSGGGGETDVDKAEDHETIALPIIARPDLLLTADGGLRVVSVRRTNPFFQQDEDEDEDEYKLVSPRGTSVRWSENPEAVDAVEHEAVYSDGKNFRLKSLRLAAKMATKMHDDDVPTDGTVENSYRNADRIIEMNDIYGTAEDAFLSGIPSITTDNKDHVDNNDIYGTAENSALDADRIIEMNDIYGTAEGAEQQLEHRESKLAEPKITDWGLENDHGIETSEALEDVLNRQGQAAGYEEGGGAEDMYLDPAELLDQQAYNQSAAALSQLNGYEGGAGTDLYLDPAELQQQHVTGYEGGAGTDLYLDPAELQQQPGAVVGGSAAIPHITGYEGGAGTDLYLDPAELQQQHLTGYEGGAGTDLYLDPAEVHSQLAIEDDDTAPAPALSKDEYLSLARGQHEAPGSRSTLALESDALSVASSASLSRSYLAIQTEAGASSKNKRP